MQIFSRLFSPYSLLSTLQHTALRPSNFFLSLTDVSGSSCKFALFSVGKRERGGGLGGECG